jgi:hypothetical protein
MKQKTYQTQKPKDKKIGFKINLSSIKLPNKMHLDAQIKFPARVQENKKYKKPKYKEKYYEE